VKTDILVIGAGFAGASTAYHLTQRDRRSLLVVDQEKVPGFHASGRNASLLLQSTAEPAIRKAAAASQKAFQQRHLDVGFHSVGSLLLGNRELLEPVREPTLIPTEYRDPREVYREIPQLNGHAFDLALWTPSDGTMDISTLLQFYLKGAREQGAEVWLDCQVQDIHGKGPFQVKTSQETIEADCLINAGGAWATAIAKMAEATPLPLNPLKRHLFVLDDVGQMDPAQPFVWSLSQNFYFRPESGGLLFSICDEESSSSLEPTVSVEISQSLAELVWQQLPELRQATQREVWSCFRTKTPDGQFVIGWDPIQPNLFWVAGLGGHGMGTSWEVGRLAADHFLSSKLHLEFDPGRFQESRNATPLSR